MTDQEMDLLNIEKWCQRIVKLITIYDILGQMDVPCKAKLSNFSLKPVSPKIGVNLFVYFVREGLTSSLDHDMLTAY